MKANRLKSVFLPEILPIKTMFVVVIVLIIPTIFSLTLHYFNFKILTYIDIPKYFPISVFSPRLDSHGTGYALLFLLLLYFTLAKQLYKNIYLTYLVGVLLIILGNLTLGGFEKAFIDPIAKGDIQYYHDAIKIDNWADWLRLYNQKQPQ